jgi:hypothetical protein
MDWDSLFERAAPYEVTVEEIRETLTTHREDGDD